MPSITDLTFSAVVREPLELGDPGFNPRAMPGEQTVLVTISFKTVVWYNEPGGPWAGSVSVIGIDHGDQEDRDGADLGIVGFLLPTYELPEIDQLQTKYEELEHHHQREYPAYLFNEDPGFDVEAFLDDSGWIPGLGPWISGASAVGSPGNMPNPIEGPTPIPRLGSHRGFMRYLGHVERTPHRDELAAVVELDDGRGSQAASRSDVIQIRV